MQFFKCEVTLNGEVDLVVTFPAGTVFHDSFVFASICELGNVLGIGYIPWSGAAIMSVDNIVPTDEGTVHFYLNVNWPTPLPIQLSIAIQ